MKNLILTYYKAIFLLLIAFSAITCRDNDSYDPASALPVINKVAASVDEDGQPANPLVSTHVGYANNTYIIQGSGFYSLKHVYFNDHESYFNPNLVTDNTIIVTIDVDTPYENGSNKLKIVTGFGTVEYDFVIAPPAPVFKGFNPVNAADGELITLKGNYFVDPIVKVGDVQAEIVSNTLTEIVAKLPAGSQHKKVSVTTLSGEVVWDTAVGTAIFDDQFYAPWNIEDWNNHTYETDSEQAFQGNVFIRKKIAGWDNIQSNWNWDDQISQYTGIKFAVRSSAPGKLKLVFNGDWGEKFLFTTDKDWKEYRFTWEELGNPQALQNISFQEFTGTEITYDFDNITFTTD